MEHASQVALWLLLNRKRINFVSTELSWVNEWGFSCFDYSISIELDGRKFEGRGSDQSESLAIEKAFTEAVERFFVVKSKLKNSNGVAAHPDKSKAELSSKFELMERDLFLSHFHSGTPFCELSKLDWKKFVSEKMLKKLDELTIDLRLYTLHRDQNFSSILAVAFGKSASTPFGIVVGLGTKSNLGNAIESALLELFRHLSYLTGDRERVSPLDLDSFQKINGVDFRHHGMLALNIDYYRQIASLFLEGRTSIAPLLDSEINTELFFLGDLEELKGIPLYASIATSKRALQLYVGSPLFSKNELNRIREYGDFLNLPHPLR